MKKIKRIASTLDKKENIPKVEVLVLQFFTLLFRKLIHKCIFEEAIKEKRSIVDKKKFKSREPWKLSKGTGKRPVDYDKLSPSRNSIVDMVRGMYTRRPTRFKYVTFFLSIRKKKDVKSCWGYIYNTTSVHQRDKVFFLFFFGGGLAY